MNAAVLSVHRWKISRRHLLYAPAVIVLVVAAGVPFGRLLWTSLHRSTPTSDSDFVGLANFGNLLTTREWWFATAVSLIAVACVVALQVVLGVVFGAALHRVSVLWPVMRIVVVVPLASLSVVNVVLWRDGFSGGYVFEWFGADPDSFVASPVGQFVAVCAAETWRGTFMVVAVTALALARVPANFSAAVIADGASALQHWRLVILPTIGPSLAAIAAFRAFATFGVIDGPLLVYGRSADVTTALNLAWFTQFETLELGLGAAMSVLVMATAGVIAAIVVPLLRIRRVP